MLFHINNSWLIYLKKLKTAFELFVAKSLEVTDSDFLIETAIPDQLPLNNKRTAILQSHDGDIKLYWE